MQDPIISRVILELPGGVFAKFKNAQFIPGFYFIPESFLLKCGQELYSFPRDFNQLMVDGDALNMVASDLFTECISDCYAHMAWPYLCPEVPYKEILPGASPSWRLAHAAGIWIEELTIVGLLPTFETLFHKPKENLYFGFVPIEDVSLFMSIIVPMAVKRHDIQILLDTEKEYRCFEDFDYRESHQKTDFYRKWYHTRTKHPQISLEGYQEQMKAYYDDIDWEVPDPVSSFEEEVETRVDVNRFLSTIDDKDKQILCMRAEGYTTQKIADSLGYKTHSAVVKRIKKLGKAYQKFSGLNFGFE